VSSSLIAPPTAVHRRLAAVRRRPAERGLTLAVGLLAAVPVIAATARSLADGWLPAGDQANIAVRAYDVFTSRTPLVGLHSDASAVTHHALYSLGPMLFWLLAPAARLGSPGALVFTMGLANTLAIIATVFLARRRGGIVLMFLTAVALLLMCRSLAPEVLHDVWNPSAGLMPLTLLIFLCWSLACGEHRLLPITVLVASFVVQCQLAFVPPVLALLAVGLGGLCVYRFSSRSERSPGRGRASSPAGAGRRRRALRSASTAPAEQDSPLSQARPSGGASRAGRRSGALWPWVLASVLVAAACWTAPLVDQLQGHPGNLTEVVRTATASTSKLGAGVGFKAVVRAVGIVPWWLHDPASPWNRKYEVRTGAAGLATVSCVLILCGLLLLVAIGLRRRQRELVTGSVIALALCVALASIAATTPTMRVLAETLGYTMWSGSPIGMFAWLMLLWPVAALAARRLAAARPTPAPLYGVATCAVAAVAALVAAGQRPDYHASEYRPLRTVYSALQHNVPSGRTVQLIGALGNETFRFKMAARFAMVRRGIRPLSPGTDTRLGSWYELDHRRYACTIWVNDGARSPARGAVALARTSFDNGIASYPLTVWMAPAGCPGARN